MVKVFLNEKRKKKVAILEIEKKELSIMTKKLEVFSKLKKVNKELILKSLQEKQVIVKRLLTI